MAFVANIYGYHIFPIFAVIVTSIYQIKYKLRFDRFDVILCYMFFKTVNKSPPRLSDRKLITIVTLNSVYMKN